MKIKTDETHKGFEVKHLSNNLSKRIAQKIGVYLAFAHLMALQFDPNGLNPDGLKDARGDILSTTQGSESVGFNRGQNNWNDIFLSKTGYGLMLLSILKNINPPCIKKPLNLFPYYNSNAFLGVILFLKRNLCPLLTLNKSN